MNWIEYFVCFRQQRVIPNGVMSDLAQISSGVAQRTVLGLRSNCISTTSQNHYGIERPPGICNLIVLYVCS